jgi:hypothetical protein
MYIYSYVRLKSKINTDRSIMHLIILNYSIIIEEFVLIIKEVQGLVEILLIDILQLKNRHPLIY